MSWSAAACPGLSHWYVYFHLREPALNLELESDVHCGHSLGANGLVDCDGPGVVNAQEVAGDGDFTIWPVVSNCREYIVDMV